MGTPTRALTVALALAAGLGCGVKKETHQRVLDTLTARKAELEETREERDRLAAEVERLEEEVERLQAEEEKAKARLRDALGSKENVEKKLASLREQREAAERRLAAFRKLREKLRKLVDTGKLEVAFRNGQMVLKMPSEILFPSGRARLSKDGKAALKEVVDILLEFKERRFMVAGHTDNVPIRTRRFRNNWDLSTTRAVQVLEFMIESGFPANKLAAAGYGEHAPVASNETEEGKKKNRRIEIILVPDLSELPNLAEEE